MAKKKSMPMADAMAGQRRPSREAVHAHESNDAMRRAGSTARPPSDRRRRGGSGAPLQPAGMPPSNVPGSEHHGKPGSRAGGDTSEKLDRLLDRFEG